MGRRCCCGLGISLGRVQPEKWADHSRKARSFSGARLFDSFCREGRRSLRCWGWGCRAGVRCTGSRIVWSGRTGGVPFRVSESAAWHDEPCLVVANRASRPSDNGVCITRHDASPLPSHTARRDDALVSCCFSNLRGSTASLVGALVTRPVETSLYLALHVYTCYTPTATWSTSHSILPASPARLHIQPAPPSRLHLYPACISIPHLQYTHDTPRWISSTTTTT